MYETGVGDEIHLARLNDRLSRLLQCDACALVRGGGHAIQDSLWVWGVLGGKDVGKTTLIRALSGRDTSDVKPRADEGTARPVVHLHAGDIDALTARLAPMEDIAIETNDDLPASMRGLVLVDLPDFDSTFDRHVGQVRRVAALLDGVIWLTTPKKVGDRRAIDEIRRVLKDCGNFVYVVNKMDWVLANAADGVASEYRRVAQALNRQVEFCHPRDADGRAFTVAARYASVDALLDAVADRRDVPDRTAVVTADPSLTVAARDLIESFERLRRALTSPPTAAAAAAGKRANLRYQSATQARGLLGHYRAHETLDRLNAALAPDALATVVERALPGPYCSRVLQSLNDDRRLFAEWSTALFRGRVAHWALLGIIAWPLTLLGTLLNRLRSGGTASAGDDADPFRQDGVGVEDRLAGIDAAFRSRLTRDLARLEIEPVPVETLTGQFRTDAFSLAAAQRHAVMAVEFDRRPGFVGLLVRRFLPFAVLIWFPMAQPLLAAVLPVDGGEAISADRWLPAVVHAASAANVLTGLTVSLLILAAMAAGVFSWSARDALRAVERLRDTPAEASSVPLTAAISESLVRPAARVRDELASIVGLLERYADGERGAPFAPGAVM